MIALPPLSIALYTQAARQLVGGKVHRFVACSTCLGLDTPSERAADDGLRPPVPLHAATVALVTSPPTWRRSPAPAARRWGGAAP